MLRARDARGGEVGAEPPAISRGRRDGDPATDHAKNREILRQKLALGHSHRDVATNLGVSIGAISKILSEAEERGLTLETVRGMSDEELERALYGATAAPRTTRPLPDEQRRAS